MPEYKPIVRARVEKSKSILIAPIFEGALDSREAKLIEREMKPLLDLQPPT